MNTAIANAGGLVSIVPTSVSVSSGSGSYNSTTGWVTFTGATKTTINGVFTSTYRNYKIIHQAALNTGADYAYLRLTTAGTEYTSLTYDGSMWYHNNSGSTGFQKNYTNDNVAYFGTFNINEAFYEINLASPQVAQNKTVRSFGEYSGLSVSAGANIGSTGQYDGFSMTIATGTLTGRLKVYGWN